MKEYYEGKVAVVTGERPESASRCASGSSPLARRPSSWRT